MLAPAVIKFIEEKVSGRVIGEQSTPAIRIGNKVCYPSTMFGFEPAAKTVAFINSTASSRIDAMVLAESKGYDSICDWRESDRYAPFIIA